MKKSEFKEIIKECVREQLNEGTYYRIAKGDDDTLLKVARILEQISTSTGNGNDLKMDQLDDAIKMLVKIKKNAKKGVSSGKKSDSKRPSHISDKDIEKANNLLRTRG